MGSLVLMFAVLAGAAVLLWQRGSQGYGFGLGAAAAMPGWALVQQVPWPVWWLLAALGGVVAYHRWGRSAAIVQRWSGRSRRSSGTASTAQVARLASVSALRRRKARRVRPSLADLSWWALQKVPGAEFAVELCRSGAQLVCSSIEDVVIVVGAPRQGKTGWLAARIIDAPGAVLVTSTRSDVLTLTGPLRAKKGPMYVFNAAGMGGIASTITFDPLVGCADPVTAAARAADMIGAVTFGGSGDREFWDAQARRVLAALLHAAALGKRRMTDISAWLNDTDRAKREVPVLLNRSPMQAFAQDAGQFFGTNDRTATSITTTIMLALGWLINSAAVEAAQPGTTVDVEQLLRERGTIYLLGAEGDGLVAPLITALTGHIAREARRLAEANISGVSSKGRLDPPLTLCLDEAYLICPVPLDSWTADMGGRGVTIIAAFQSRAQILERYGAAKTAQIMTNAGARLVFGGLGDRDDLEFWSTLAGDRDEITWSVDQTGRQRTRSSRLVRVMSPAAIAALPEGRVLVFRRGLRPVLGRARMAWDRPDMRAVHEPDALSVKARAAITRARAAVAAWTWKVCEPTVTWATEGTRAVDAAIAAALVGFGRWCAAEWTDLWQRVLGTTTPPGKPVPYTPPAVAPPRRLTVVPDASPQHDPRGQVDQVDATGAHLSGSAPSDLSTGGSS